MRGRVDELYNDRCKPKPQFHVKLWDTRITTYPEEAQEETDSIDIYVHLVV